MEQQESGAKLVQMRLQPRTLDRLNSMSTITGIDNRTRLVAASINLTGEILGAIESGAKVYIERADGTKEVLSVIFI